MADCQFCGHNSQRYTKAAPICTLWPEWKTFALGHFCGQFDDSSATPASLAAGERSRQQWAANQVNQQVRAIKAEKALKALRSQLKIAKGEE